MVSFSCFYLNSKFLSYYPWSWSWAQVSGCEELGVRMRGLGKVQVIVTFHLDLKFDLMPSKLTIAIASFVARWDIFFSERVPFSRLKPQVIPFRIAQCNTSNSSTWACAMHDVIASWWDLFRIWPSRANSNFYLSYPWCMVRKFHMILSGYEKF